MDEYRYQPVPPEDGYERAAGRRYRRAVARSLGGGKRAYRPAQYTRSGIAQDYQNEQRRHLEHRARDVAILFGVALMNQHVAFALDHPVFDPERQITARHFWRVGRFSLGLTCNIGME